MKHLHYWTAIVLLGGTGMLLASRGAVDRVPPSRPLELMPTRIGAWTGTDVPLEGYVLDVLGKGVFLNRTYLAGDISAGDSPAGHGPAANNRADPVRRGPVGLFIGYFPTQRTGQAIHSPQNCLPGAGWVFNSSRVLNLNDSTGKPHQIGDYLISNGKQQDEVLYWYQSHGRSVASDYEAKGYTLLDSIRYHRTDAALIRIVSPVLPGETLEQAHSRALDFTTNLLPLLPAYIPD